MASLLKVDKLDPQSGTALEIGTSGDTVTVPTGAGLTVTDEVKTNKISPATGTAFALGDSGDTFTVPSGATIVNSGTATGFGITAASFLPTANPLIINGDMAVAQRTTSTASVSSGANWVTDRYSFNIGTAGTWTLTQEALTADEAFEDGFATAFKADNTTANASLSAGSYIQFHQKIEAQDLQLLKSGESTAEKVTLAFWVKATKTGTNIIEIWVSDNSRAVSVAYTVDSTNTWEKKIIDIPADTGGTGIDNNNGAGWTVIWWMAAGTDTSSGTLRTAWASNAVSADRAVGQVNNADSTSNNFHITGVQLEVGEYTSSTIPPFRHESYGDNLMRCQRYYYKIIDTGYFGVGNIDGSNDAQILCQFPTTMRTAPTALETSGTATDYYIRTTSNNTCTSVPAFSDTGVNLGMIICYKTSHGLTNQIAAFCRAANSDAMLAWSAEL